MIWGAMLAHCIILRLKSINAAIYQNLIRKVLNAIFFLFIFSITYCQMNQSTISTMCTISEVLRKTLENLAKCDFTRFKHDLWNRGPIPRQRLEEATVEDTVTMLVQTYTRSNCGPVVLDILRNMNFNQLALDLEKSFSCGKYYYY